ncbi:hypothetical protein METBIDRAFT_166181 [Metschnikowia bicuspidata var. bicuspidata NRRL YB-4993]|uniref:Uncharacterized protein n=1 Tax=Metschnikowia bicuspidata var. bicuspidata NRRL YB-4993 TaxID=869754 RepID=A0A1A0HAJ3_9ASCO|nr:hypothetical protein METBIDRAFT_166181 [Metschnikowia bicuspidata var. bicuspidata NRRL YB-4993]OBA20898.1 hypothetical protein METBIDRAFT_166181 [Metschnikowia bicuspidata var. bicuspidata NRRL YB-4993]
MGGVMAGLWVVLWLVYGCCLYVTGLGRRTLKHTHETSHCIAMRIPAIRNNHKNTGSMTACMSAYHMVLVHVYTGYLGTKHWHTNAIHALSTKVQLCKYRQDRAEVLPPEVSGISFAETERLPFVPCSHFWDRWIVDMF